jgi:hypothetical protein
MITLLLTLAIVLGIVMVVFALQVEDWSRDLTTNYAETTETAEHPGLRSIYLSVSPREAVELVESSVDQLERWQRKTPDLSPLPDRSGSSETDGLHSSGVEHSSSPPIVLRYIRKTPLLGFIDDITVTITAVYPANNADTTEGAETTEEGTPVHRCRIDISSQSRVGKGDLGQNPRNIRELSEKLNALAR